MTPFTFEKTPSTPQKQPPASTAVARLALTAGSVTAAGSLTTLSACAGAHWATTALTANAATARRASDRRGGVKIGRAHAELQSLMRNSYAVFCLKKKKQLHTKTQHTEHYITKQ